MPSIAEIETLNRDLADRNNRNARTDPQSPYAGKKVGIADGEVVVVGESWAEVVAQLLKIQPDRRKVCCFNAAGDFDTPVWI